MVISRKDIHNHNLNCEEVKKCQSIKAKKYILKQNKIFHFFVFLTHNLFHKIVK